MWLTIEEWRANNMVEIPNIAKRVRTTLSSGAGCPDVLLELVRTPPTGFALFENGRNTGAIFGVITRSQAVIETGNMNISEAFEKCVVD
jgi:hypothetical protein